MNKVFCSHCDKALNFSCDKIAERVVYKNGELSYICLSHVVCIPVNEKDKWESD